MCPSWYVPSTRTQKSFSIGKRKTNSGNSQGQRRKGRKPVNVWPEQARLAHFTKCTQEVPGTVLVTQLQSSVALGKRPKLSKPQFFHLQNGFINEPQGTEHFRAASRTQEMPYEYLINK